jgi:hypothetical protein
VIDRNVPLANLYAYQPESPPAQAAVGEAVAAALDATPSAYDSHPAPAQRLAWAHAMGTRPTADCSDAEEEAWGLFADRAAVEALMTDQVRRNVKTAHGIAIKGAAA